MQLAAAPMAGVNLEDLLEHVGLSTDDLDTKCSDEDLSNLSLVIPSWETVSPFLSLKEADIEDIRSESDKNRAKVFNMLKKWKKRHGFRATFRVLVDVFLMKLEDADMAEKVCKQLSSKSIHVGGWVSPLVNRSIKNPSLTHFLWRKEGEMQMTCETTASP